MLTLLCLFALQLSGQYNVKAMNMGTDVPGKNFIKTNLTSMLLKNFSLQYERALTKTISASVSMPTSATTQSLRNCASIWARRGTAEAFT